MSGTCDPLLFFFKSIFNFASRWKVIPFHNSNDNADNDLDIEKDVFCLVTHVCVKFSILITYNEFTLCISI